jgi:hypothetical protein
MGTYILRKGVASLSDLVDGNSANGYPGGGYLGRDYFVNNITGKSAHGGTSWDDAMDEVSTAITASEVYRQLPSDTTNEYIRNRIFVQGTGTAYTALTALPNYCDIIGVGADPRGNGAGIVIIGVAAADGIAGTARGLNMYNIQFRSGGAFWCADFVSLFRSRIENCAFHSNGATAADGGIRFTAASGGVVIKDCWWNGDTDFVPKVGIQASGTHFNESEITGCNICGTTAGILIDNTVKNGDQTLVHHNHIGDTGKGCVTAIDDNMPADLVGYIQYCNNSVMGTNLITIANSGAARCHGNVSANAFVAVTAS